MNLGSNNIAVDVESVAPIQPIGMGGQGGVWLAEADILGGGGFLQCAVKQVKKAWVTRDGRKVVAVRPITERKCLTECGHHPFITTCFAAFQTHDSLFMCLELAPGGDLYTLSNSTGCDGLPEGHARFYFTCIALALRHLHCHGWVYRDIKLENVLVDRCAGAAHAHAATLHPRMPLTFILCVCVSLSTLRSAGYARLCDFGFAKKASTMRTFTDCGTDEYAAPELLRGAGRGQAADWWALGILLHEMFMGHPPFEGYTSEEVRTTSPLAYLRGTEPQLCMRTPRIPSPSPPHPHPHPPHPHPPTHTLAGLPRDRRVRGGRRRRGGAAPGGRPQCRVWRRRARGRQDR